jgi:hypothetical protein
LAGLLALLLLVAATFSASHALHRSLHQGSDANHHLCLLCAFAKGQASAASVALVAFPLFFWSVRGPCFAATLVLPSFDYRLSPSRAPPAP